MNRRLPMISFYPDFSPIAMEQRPLLHPLFQALPDGVSEFTFANIYLFREAHQYRIARLPEDMQAGRPHHNEAAGVPPDHHCGAGVPPASSSTTLPPVSSSARPPSANAPSYVIAGRDGDRDFFMLPFAPPGDTLLADLFARFGCLKNATAAQAAALAQRGMRREADRNNFDYLYSRAELAHLPGQRYHKKKNLIGKFLRTHAAEGRPLLEEYLPHALEVLDAWCAEREDRGKHGTPDEAGRPALLAAPGDYAAAREALERSWDLQLCGGIYYIDQRPVAYTLGEENAQGRSFVVHFEKALAPDRHPGIYQYINQVFAGILPETYETINREQDLGDPGLRQAKETYHPTGFVEKFRVYAR